MASMTIRPHHVTLRGEKVVLRPMSEDDRPTLLRWNSDPEVLYFSEGNEVQSYTLEQVQAIYRGVSQAAFCFIAEVRGQPIGEGWLQEMNLPYLRERHAGEDCRRIDLVIDEKTLWGKGVGSEMIALLTRFGFEGEHADVIYGCGIADYNPRSLRAFQKNGYEIVEKIAEPPGMKAKFCYDVRRVRYNAPHDNPNLS